jgi:hypothetical protein
MSVSNLCNEILFEDNKKINTEKVKTGEKEALKSSENQRLSRSVCDRTGFCQDCDECGSGQSLQKNMTPPEDFELEKSNVLILGAQDQVKLCWPKLLLDT